MALERVKAQMAQLEAEEKNLRRTLDDLEREKAYATIDKTRNQNTTKRISTMSEDGSLADEEETVVLKPHQPAVKEHSSYLPDEILLQILSYLTTERATAQNSLACCCLLSRQWYAACVPLLYARPVLYGKSYDPFVQAICPSINVHVRKSPLAELVRVLDLRQLVHQGSKSVTARLLGRTKGNLEEFYAPQASFGISCLPALSKCAKLKTLDLSLVSETPPLPDLLKATTNLANLNTFRLPRSAGFGVHHKASAFPPWAPNIHHLTLSGGIDGHFLHGVAKFPPNLHSLTIEHCPLVKGYALAHLLRTAIKPLSTLQSLKIAHMPRLAHHALDDILWLCPQISHLSVSADYVTPAMFDEGQRTYNARLTELPPDLQHKNLRILELTNSNEATHSVDSTDTITPIDVLIAVDEGVLPSLRQVKVAGSLRWQNAEETEHLADALKEGSKRDWEEGTGVFEGKVRSEVGPVLARKIWENVAGVWLLEG